MYLNRDEFLLLSRRGRVPPAHRARPSRRPPPSVTAPVTVAPARRRTSAVIARLVRRPARSRRAALDR